MRGQAATDSCGLRAGADGTGNRLRHHGQPPPEAPLSGLAWLALRLDFLGPPRRTRHRGNRPMRGSCDRAASGCSCDERREEPVDTFPYATTEEDIADRTTALQHRATKLS